MSWLERLRGVRKVMKELGHEKERAALALLSLSFFGVIYLLVSLNAPPGWGRAFGALALCYLLGFVALASEWFWARWFSSGLGWSGFMVGVMSLVMIGWQPVLGIYTALHAVIVAMLMGAKMATRYELQPTWRQRYAMDEYGVSRLGKAVTRASASLPTLIVWALAPREGQGMALIPLLTLGLGAVGLAAMLRLRTWGLMAAGAAGAAVAISAALSPGLVLTASEGLESGMIWTALGSPLLAGAWATMIIAPFVLPAWRYLRR